MIKALPTPPFIHIVEDLDIEKPDDGGTGDESGSESEDE
jgi:hypothetical protein